MFEQTTYSLFSQPVWQAQKWKRRGRGRKGNRGERPRPLPISLPPNSLHLSTPATQAIFSIFFREREGQGQIQDFFFRRGCTRLLLYFNTNKPHSFFFLQNTSCIRKPQVISGGGGAQLLHPPPRSAPEGHWKRIIKWVMPLK